MTDDKSLATLQAAEALRGIVIERDGHGYYVRMGALETYAENFGGLVALLERMGVRA